PVANRAHNPTAAASLEIFMSPPWGARQAALLFSQRFGDLRAVILPQRGTTRPPSLCPAADETRCGAPGVVCQRREASDGVDASGRLVRSHASANDGTEQRFAMGRLQLAKLFRAAFQLD